MYDAKKIVPGIIIFLCLITLPTWYSMASGKVDYVPEPEIVTAEKQCVEPTQYMIDNHPDLLDEWRTSVVREDTRIYVASDSQEYDISLTRTCLGCHSNKAQFCDKCHDYVAVKPDCWTCHNIPEEEQ